MIVDEIHANEASFLKQNIWMTNHSGNKEVKGFD